MMLHAFCVVDPMDSFLLRLLPRLTGKLPFSMLTSAACVNGDIMASWKIRADCAR